MVSRDHVREKTYTNIHLKSEFSKNMCNLYIYIYKRRYLNMNVLNRHV
jgi:hypothetical protein